MRKLIMLLFVFFFCCMLLHASQNTRLYTSPDVAAGIFGFPEYVNGKPVKYQISPIMKDDKVEYPPNYLVIWTARWCAKCPTMKAIGDKLSKEGYDVFYIDYDKNVEEATEKHVQALPTAIVYEDYKEVGRIVGVSLRTKSKVENQLRQVLKKNEEEKEDANDYRLY